MRRLAGCLIPEELSQHDLDFLELRFGLFDGGLALAEALLVVGLFYRAVFVLVRAEVLDLLAAVLDLC